MGRLLRQLLRDPFVLRPILLLCVLLLMYGFLWVLKLEELPPQVPLFYSLPRGEEQLTAPSTLLFLPGTSILLLFLHTGIAALLYPHQKLAAQLLIVVCAIVWIVLFLAFVNILFLVS